MQSTVTATDRVPPRAGVRELSSEHRPVIQALNDEHSVDVDLVDLEQAAASDNVFLQPAPPELCPWCVAPGTIPPVNVIRVSQGEVLNSETLPRFSLLGPDSSQYGAEVGSSSLPRFADGSFGPTAP